MRSRTVPLAWTMTRCVPRSSSAVIEAVERVGGGDVELDGGLDVEEHGAWPLFERVDSSQHAVGRRRWR